MKNSRGFSDSRIRRALVIFIGIYFIRAFLYNACLEVILVFQGQWLNHKEWLQSLYPNTLHSLALSILCAGVLGTVCHASLLATGIAIFRSWNIRKWKGVVVCSGIAFAIFVGKEIIWYFIEQPDQFTLPSIGLRLYPAVILYGFACKYFSEKEEL